jgi:hypothetical protein
MERFNKKLMLITIFSCILLLSGCDKIHLGPYNAAKDDTGSVQSANDQTDSDALTEQNNNQATIDGQDNKDDTSGADSTEPTKSPDSVQTNIQTVANTELNIYSINVDTGDIEPVTALIPQGTEVTPELIVNKVAEAMADQSLTVGIQSVTTQKDAVVVNFYKDQPPLKDVGGGIESAILDAIAQSLTDNNLKNYSKVIYRVEGKAYVSDHFELGIDEVYLGNN